MKFSGGLTYAERDGRALLLDVLAPEDAVGAPVVLYVHGGGWSGGDRGAGMHPWLNPLLAAHGYVTASLTYRLSDEAVWPAQLDDVGDAVTWLRAHADELGGDPARVGLWGHSAGAHIAAVAALTARGDDSVQAVAVSACPADFGADAGWQDPSRTGQATALVGAIGEDARARLVAASPVQLVHPGAPPFLIAHGTADDVVPLDQGERLRDALLAVGATAQWVPVPGAGHDWADLPSGRGRVEAQDTFGSVALEFFDAHLR